MLDASYAYQVLKLEQNSSYDEIKDAYRKLVLELHPDRNDSEQDGIKFKLVTEAYHILKNHKKTNDTRDEVVRNKYTDQKTKQEKTVSRTNWGARDEKIPEADWERYTKQTEQSDPFFWKKYVADFWRDYDSRVKQTKSPFDFEIGQGKKNDPDLFSSVDKSLCIGCCSCETIAPQVFAVDKTSKMNPKSSVINQKGARRDKIIDAAQTCPTKAIRVEEKETGKRLYPY